MVLSITQCSVLRCRVLVNKQSGHELSFKLSVRTGLVTTGAINNTIPSVSTDSYFPPPTINRVKKNDSVSMNWQGYSVDNFRPKQMTVIVPTMDLVYAILYIIPNVINITAIVKLTNLATV